MKNSQMRGCMDKNHVLGDLIYLVVLIQLVGGVLIALGYKTRFAAPVLAGFSMVATLIFHVGSGIDILKDSSIAGGCIFMFAYGPGPLSLDRLQRASVRARRAWRTMGKYDLQATGPKVDSSRSGLAGKQAVHYWRKTDKQVIEDLFSDDISAETTRGKRRVVKSILRRNEKAVASLKLLYGGVCQLTAKKYAFKAIDGQNYCEAHHLIPLGEGGADSSHNLIIVSPLIHRMFHYAKVSRLDLGRIVDNKLKIKINGKTFILRWRPKHAELVAAAKSAEMR